MKKRINDFKDSYFLYSFKKDKLAIISFLILFTLIVSSFAAPLIAPYNPYDSKAINLLNSEKPPAWVDGGSKDFVLGTDMQGRDMVSTMLYGMRLSVLIGIGAVFLQALSGIVIGLFAGYVGGKLDAFLMRVADIQLSFATMMVAILISAIVQTVFGVGRYNELAVPILIVIIGIAEWPQYARTVRASVLNERNKEYVEAAKVTGLSSVKIMFGHILPNTMSSVLVISTVQVANAIMSEAALSFLGLGMPVNKPSLGSLINSGFEYIFSGSWWITLFPGILLITLVLVINILGDWLRDVLNPKLYKD